MRNDPDQYANLQRLNSAVLARHEWTSSLIGMQKSGEEIHQRRNRTHRKVNEFVQELLQKRTDTNSFDDQGALERYRRFRLRNQNDDDDLLDEFNRRLRALNRHPRIFRSNRRSSLQTENSTSTIDIQTEDLDTTNITDRSTSPISELTFEQTKSFLPLETSSTRNSFQRARFQENAGSEIILHSSSSTPPIQAASNVLLFNNCFFPRSLTMNRNRIDVEEKKVTSRRIEEFNRDELFHMLDQLDRTCSQDQFTDMLSNLKMSSTLVEQKTDESPLIDEIEEENHEEISTIRSNLFHRNSTSEKYFQTFSLTIDQPKKIRVYTMTIGTMELTTNVWLPYSILEGHRPVLQISAQTNFKRIRSKNSTKTCRVTAIDSLENPMENLQENDILLQIDDQLVWQLEIDDVRKILSSLTKKCSLTIIRLSRPLPGRMDFSSQ